MSRIQDEQLDRQLKNLQDDVTWQMPRKDRVRTAIQTKVQNREYRSSPSRPLLHGWVPAFLSLFLIIGLSTIVFFSSTGPLAQKASDVQRSSSHLSDIDENEDSEQMPSDKKEQSIPAGFVATKVTTENAEKIQHIEEAGFNVHLPSLMPNEAKEMITIKMTDNAGPSGVDFIHADYASSQQGKKIFDYWQEALTDGNNKASADQIAENRYGSGLEKTTVMGNPAYFYYTDLRQQTDLFIVSDHYAYTLNSPQFTREQLIQIAESIELK